MGELFNGGSLIPAEASVAVFAALFVIAAAGFLLEKTNWGKAVTGAVWAILIAIVLSNLHIIPRDAPAYGVVFDYLVPVLVPLFLFDADLRRIVRETGRTLGAFGLACAGTVLGALIGVAVLDLGAREPALAGIFTATYVGGSVNYAALIESTGFDNANVVSAATAIDNLMSALFLAMLALMPGWAWLARRFPQHDFTDDAPDDGQETAMAQTDAAWVTSGSMALALAASILIVAVSNGIVDWLNIEPYRYLIITVLAVVPATAFPNPMKKLQGGFELGLILAFVFFAAIAAGADIPNLISVAPILAVFVLIILSVHAIVVFGLGSLFRISLPELITASNAAVLGATTAPALAAVKGWRKLITPGVLVGVLGYAVGTFLGVGVFEFWKSVGG